MKNRRAASAPKEPPRAGNLHVGQATGETQFLVAGACPWTTRIASRGVRTCASVLSLLLAAGPLPAQELNIAPVKPDAPFIVRPYLAPTVPPPRTTNADRIRALIRAGKLYLTVQDAIAITLENNIDVEIARYNPIIAAWNLERAQAGGALPGVPSGASQAGTVASGQGVAGSQAAVGVSITGASPGTGRTANATISQVGPVTQNLDPAIQDATTFSHTSIPQPNVVQSVTPVLISNTHVYNTTLQQGFLTGGNVSINYTEHYLSENAPTDVLNPSVAPNLSLSVQHNLLRGFGVAVNARTITVARMNLTTSDLNFKSQIISLVTQVVGAYFALVADYADLNAKTSAQGAAQKLYADTAKQVRIGTVTKLELTTAESQEATTSQAVIDSRAALEQQEIELKNIMSRNGAADPVLGSAQIIPLDSMQPPPATGSLPPVKQLVQQALDNRPDLKLAQMNVSEAEISALGTRNGLLPNMQVFATARNAGLAGTAHVVGNGQFSETPDRYFVGGIGTGLGQVFRRNFPTQMVGVFFQASIGNNLAQADYGIDQLQLRQTELTTRKTFNQVEVEVLNYVVALRQAKARYAAAVQTRILNEKLFTGEEEKLSVGSSVPYNVVLQQRDLIAAQAAETSALSTYTNARIALDQAVGTTLDTWHVSIIEAQTGKVARTSSLPVVLPKAP